MKYLFVFLLLGLMVSCGDASGEATGEASENVNAELKEYSDDEVTESNYILLLKNDMKPVTGIVRGWHENGQLWYEKNYKDGKRVGSHREWHENGQLRFEVNFKDGKFEGLSRNWFEDGQLWYEKNYKDGELISEKCFDRYGNLIKC